MIDRLAFFVLMTSSPLLLAETIPPPPSILTPAPATTPATVPFQAPAQPADQIQEKTPAPTTPAQPTTPPVKGTVPAEKPTKPNETATQPEVPVIKITSTSFEPNKAIPSKYTCDGGDVSPALSFDAIPSDAKSIAIIVDDPDAPSGDFVHWVAWNIPPTTKGLGESALVLNQGLNGFGETRYRGPCPPRGKPHHYHFKVYALDIMLNLPYGIHKNDLEKAMEGHILGQGELIGTYQRR